MRVALDVTPLLDARTGVGRVTAAVAEGLLRQADVDVVGYSVSLRGRDRLAEVVPPGLTLARGPMAAQPLRRLWLRTDHPVIERWSGPVDVVHGPNFVVPPAARAAQLATVHDLTCVHHPELCTPDTLQYPALLRRALRRGAHIHTVSHFVAGEVVDVLGADPDRVHAVPNGLDASPPGDPAKGREVAMAERYVLALGTVEPRKDLPSLVRAFDALAADRPELHLVVAGPNGWGVEAFEAAREQATHRVRIARLGWVDDAVRADLLAGAAAFAYPSRYEGFGLPPLEAMAAGVPVVTTTAGALPEVVGDAARTVPPGDADALAEALAEVLDDREVAGRLVARGFERAAMFSWDRTVADLVALYRVLAG